MSLEASMGFPSSHPNAHTLFFHSRLEEFWSFLKSFMNSGLKIPELEEGGNERGDTCLFNFISFPP